MNQKLCLVFVMLFLLFLSCDRRNEQGNSFERDTIYTIVFLSSRDFPGIVHITMGNMNEVYVMDVNGAGEVLDTRRLTKNPTWEFEPVYSPDGQSIVFYSALEFLLYERILLMDQEGQNQRDLGPGRYSLLSPDGYTILFQIPYPDPGVLALMNTDGTDRRLLTKCHDPVYTSFGQDFPMQFTRDSYTILFKRRDQYTNTYAIFTINTDGSNLNKIVENCMFGRDCSLSPDESKIIFTSYRTGTAQVHLVDSDGSNECPLTIPQGETPNRYSLLMVKRLSLYLTGTIRVRFIS